MGPGARPLSSDVAEPLRSSPRLENGAAREGSGVVLGRCGHPEYREPPLRGAPRPRPREGVGLGRGMGSQTRNSVAGPPPDVEDRGVAAWQGAAQAHVGNVPAQESREALPWLRIALVKLRPGDSCRGWPCTWCQSPRGAEGSPRPPEAGRTTSGPLCSHLANGHSQCPCMVRAFLPSSLTQRGSTPAPHCSRPGP